MKYIKFIAVVIAICFIFSACNIREVQQLAYFGFKTSDFTIVEESDTHGGFHGDGYYYLILDCSENVEQAEKIVEDWNELPFTENLQLAMYGGVKDDIGYCYFLAELAHLPAVSNGYYKFLDRYSDAVDYSDDTDLLSRCSFNFSVAVYDLDTNTLYYFEMDT